MTDNLIFQILDWDYFHDDDESEERKLFKIRLFGKTKNQETVYLQVDDFTPYFYFEVEKGWSKTTVITFMDEIKKRVNKSKSDDLISYKIEEKYKFCGFTNFTKFSFVKLTFSSYDGMKAYAYMLGKTHRIYTVSKKPIQVKLYESNMNPILRFMHIRQLEAVGWVSIPKKDLEDIEDTTCSNLNYRTKWTNVSKVEDRLIEKFIIAAFDIECTSKDGTFPQPQRDGDKVIQISVTLSRFGEDDCYYKHLLSLGKTSDIEGITVESFATEEKLLLGFTKLMRKLNPDIITGYNIFGFDFNYLYERSKKLEIEHQFCRLSRINGESSEFITSNLSSAALGTNIMKYYKMTGRVVVDLMKVVQRDYKISSYKLDYVASYFIREGIHDFKSDEKNKTTYIKTKNTFGLALNQYITITYVEGAVETKIGDGHKFKVAELGKDFIIIDEVIDTSEFMGKGYKVYWCQAKDDITPREIFENFEKGPDERSLIGAYCVQDSALCNKLISKLQVITNNVSMANVCHVPLSYLFLRGQGVKIFSLVAKRCRELNHLIPLIQKPREFQQNVNYKDKKKLMKERDDEENNDNRLEKFIYSLNNKHRDDDEETEETKDVGYEGAIVFPPSPAVHYEPIIVLDYASLYPNSMIFRNLSHEMYVDHDMYGTMYDNLPGYRYNKITYKNNDGTSTTCVFAEKLDGTKGIIPQILLDLLGARKKYKKLMEAELDAFKKSILDSLQLAYKVTANSLYGQTGASTSPVRMVQIAASTTCTGREALLYSKYFIENIFSKLVNTAVTDRKIFLKEATKIYKYYPTNFEVTVKDPETKKLNQICIHINTDENVPIADKQFIVKDIEYELDYADKKTRKLFGDKYKKVFEETLFGTEDEFLDKIVKVFTSMHVDERHELYDKIKSIVLHEEQEEQEENNNTEQEEKENIYEKYDKYWNDMGFNSLKKINKEFFKALKELPYEDLETFFNKLDVVIDNIGFKNREEFFDKMYYTFNSILKNHKIEPEIIYGDSVTENTPLLLRKEINGTYQFEIKTIKNLGSCWIKYNDDKVQDKNIKYQVWSDDGWTNIKRVIKHKTNKQIYEILTHTGCVRVTEDHSLLKLDKTVIEPKECNMNTELLHSFPTEFNEIKNICDDLAYIYGFFMGDGSCGKYGEGQKVKYSWALNSNDMKLCEKLKNKLEKIYNKRFKILDTLKSSGVYKIVPSCRNIKSFVIEYIEQFYDDEKMKTVPIQILNGSIQEKKAFLEGFYDANGCRKDTLNSGCHRFDQKSQISSMGLYYLLKSLGYEVSLNKRDDKPEIFRLTYSKNTQRKNSDKIKKIRKIEKKEQWVYDLETENHHFHAGVGQLIVHNTDSVFYKAKITNLITGERLKNKKALKLSIILGIWSGICICASLPPPMAQIFEKVLYPLVIQGKKRYVGNLYEKNIFDFKQKSMGIELKRRDNAPIVKKICSGIIDEILNKHSSQGACDFTRNMLKKIITGGCKMDMFIITKTLKGNALTKDERKIEAAKPKDQRSYANRSTIVHAVLADRMADRDPGNKPLSNDRIPYVYIETKTEPALQGERVETPDYIIENKLKIDYLFYITNQIMTPCMKFLDLIVHDAESIFKEFIIKEENRRHGVMPIVYYAKDDDKEGDKNNFEDFDSLTEKVNKKNKEKATFSLHKKKKIITSNTKQVDIPDDIFDDMRDISKKSKFNNDEPFERTIKKVEKKKRKPVREDAPTKKFNKLCNFDNVNDDFV